MRVFDGDSKEEEAGDLVLTDWTVLRFGASSEPLPNPMSICGCFSGAKLGRDTRRKTEDNWRATSKFP
jgi:hypothetical protein